MSGCDRCGREHPRFVARAAGEEGWEPVCGAEARDAAEAFVARRDLGERDAHDLRTGPLAVVRGCVALVEVREDHDGAPVSRWLAMSELTPSFVAYPAETWGEAELAGLRLWPFTAHVGEPADSGP